MEFEHHQHDHHHHHHHHQYDDMILNNPIVHQSSSDDDDHHDPAVDSFRMLDKGIPSSNDSMQNKLSWLRSQIIGGSAEFDTPFGRRTLTYSDHTASGRSLTCIENYITTNLLPFYGNSHTSDSFVGYQTTKKVHEAANYVKQCLGGGNEHALMFCGSGSTAAVKRLQEVMGITVPSILRERVLGCLAERERWVVFVGPYEHHSNILTWQQSLAEVVEIGLNQAGLLDTEALREGLEFYKSKNRPILGSFSACSNVTGVCTNTRAVARLLHRYGGFACFDFAASGPYVKIDMRSSEIDGYDAIFLSTHKFVGGPGSPGVLLMSKALYRLGSSPPSTCGGGTVDFVSCYNGGKDTIYSDSVEEREDAGTPPIIQKVRAALAFWIKEYVGYRAIESMEQKYAARALERLVPNPNISVLGNTDAKRQAIVSFLVYSTENSKMEDEYERRGQLLDMWRESGDRLGKPLHGPFVAKLLNDLFGIQARGGCACAGPYGHRLLDVDEQQSLAFRSIIQKGYAGIKPGWTRVSFPYYMPEEEVEFILTAIEFVAIYGQRFLRCYHLSWRTGTWTFKRNALKDMTNIMMKTSGNEEKEEKVRRYTSYLETAKRVAGLLPKFPPQRKIPQDIDIGLVPFRV